ncbi:MAG TPA: peptidoglycan editing factor PgeF, partial [Pseudomonadales bacterium]
PAHVRALVTTRHGGVSLGRYASFNQAAHCGDDPVSVEANRRRLLAATGAPSVCWLNQVHGVDVVDAAHAGTAPPVADASFSRSPSWSCAILTADCLPVLLCDRAGTFVAAAHCGWRGLAHGVLRRLFERLPPHTGPLLAWLGPAIGAARYEVGDDVREALHTTFPAAVVTAALRPGRIVGKWQADLYALATAQLGALGVTQIHGGGFCTYADERFYSYRRDGVTGRMAALIWLTDGKGASAEGA